MNESLLRCPDPNIIQNPDFAHLNRLCNWVNYCRILGREIKEIHSQQILSIMKKLFILPLMILTLGIISCKKDVNQWVTNQDDQVIALADKPGYNPLAIPFRKCDNWIVSNYNMNGVDYTSDFTGYKLNFCPDNTVIFYNDIYAIHGYWYYRWIDAGGNTMVLYFDVPERLPGNLWDNIAGNWNVIKVRNNHIVFEANFEDPKVLEIDRVKLQDTK